MPPCGCHRWLTIWGNVENGKSPVNQAFLLSMAGVSVNLLPKTRSHGFLRLDFWETRIGNVKPLSVTTTWNDCAALTLQYGASARARAVACPRQPLVPVRRARVHRTARLGSRPQAREQRLDPSFPPGLARGLARRARCACPLSAGSACPPRDGERQHGREHAREQRRADGQRA